MSFGQLPMIPTAIMAQTGYLYIMEKNKKLAGMITETFKKPTAADIMSRVKNIQWIRDEAVKAIPESIKASVKGSYDKMITTMSSPMTMLSVPASMYVAELDKINALLSNTAGISQQKAENIIQKAETKMAVEALASGAVKSVESVASGVISAQEIGNKAIIAATKIAPKKMSKWAIGGIIAGSVVALTTIGYAITRKRK